jgi:hypothetical protein
MSDPIIRAYVIPKARTPLCPKCGGLWDEVVVWIDTSTQGLLFAQRDCLGCGYMDEVPLSRLASE